MTYIDKYKALNLDFRINVRLFESRRKTAERAVQAYANAISAISAADVRPVVLCRDCKHWELSKIEPLFRVCTYVCGATFVRSSEDFCSRGEKREES